MFCKLIAVGWLVATAHDLFDPWPEAIKNHLYITSTGSNAAAGALLGD